jgi:thiol-disulfide isomerase/thioredoxin
MRLNFQLLLLACIIAVTAHAQNDPSPSVNIGDPAPPLRLKTWLKGMPFQKFEKGKVYVLEFWATWCRPCKAAIPRLSLLAAEYSDRVTILGIDIYEQKNTSIEKVKAFVDSMGQRMDYYVATEDSNFMVADWIEATGEKDKGIPATFVVNAEGRLAWIGHPKDLDQILPKIVTNTWDVKEALAKRKEENRLRELDKEAYYTLMEYSSEQLPGSVDRPDSALLVINEIVRKEPKLKYAPWIVHYTFSSLLITNTDKAYEYGKVAIVTPTYDEPAYDMLIGGIEGLSQKFNFSVEIYQLGAEAYQQKINQIPYPELAKMPKYYSNMAEMYWRAKNKSKAIDAVQKAIEVMKSRTGFTAAEMAELESRLRQYKNN